MKHDDETALIAATFDALNEGTLAQAMRRLDRFIYREPVTSQTPAPQVELEGTMADDGNVLDELWESWWHSERDDAKRALSYLAEHKRLRAEDVETYTYLVKHTAVCEPKFTQRARGRVRMEFAPRFKSVATLVAYVLLRLSNRHERIVVCPAPKVGQPDAKCGHLALDKPHVGHPMRFCSAKCRHRFNSQKVRDKNRAPAKHK